MSHVTNAILSFALGEAPRIDPKTGAKGDVLEGEYEAIESINAWLDRHAGHQAFGVNLSNVYTTNDGQRIVGGRKRLETNVYVAAFNSLPWRRPECAVFMMRREEDDGWEVIALGRRQS